MNYYVMQLKIPLYGDDNFYYYDVLEALARDVFQRAINESRTEVVEDLIAQNIWKEGQIDDFMHFETCEEHECKYCF